MKIVMFGQKHTASREGGIEVAVGELSRRMAARGHQVICYDRRRGGCAAVLSSLWSALRSALGQAEVVHIHAEGSAFFCWLPKVFGKRVVVTIHGLDWQREKWQGRFAAAFLLAGEKMAVRYGDAIIVLSRNLQAYFQTVYGRHTHWIPNGVSPPEILPGEIIREQLGLERDGYLLFLGRLVPEKGIHTLISAFRQIKTEKKLVIAGASSDTEAYVSRLKEQAAGDPRILFPGFVQGQLLGELYSNAWVYVLPSTLEGMPLGLLEAMSYGNCCLVSDIPECTEVTGNRAMQFRVRDQRDLREKLQQLCDDRAQVAHYRNLVRQGLAGFDWETIAERTLKLYNADFDDQ